MGLTAPGIGSGLDVKSMVDAMVKADIAKSQEHHDKRLKEINTEISALGQLKGALCTLQGTLSNLSSMSQFYKMRSNISEPGYFTALVTNEAPPGVYQIQVQALAQSQSLASDYYTNPATSVGNGTITINLGTYSSDLSTFTINPDTSPVTITIDPSNDSLSSVCDAINAADAGVTASIVQDSLGARLSITSNQTGVNHAIQILGSLTQLNYDPTMSNTQLTETIAAQNSLVQLNGMLINQTSNQLENILNGITLNLTQANSSQTITLTVEKNQEQLINCVNDFVKKYNDCIMFLNEVTSYNFETKQPGQYQGDSQIKNLKSSLFQLVSNFTFTIDSGKQLTLSNIGIKTTKSATLEINQEVFNNALNENYSSIGALFAKTVRVTDPDIQANSINTTAKAGSYDVVLSEFTPGVSMTGTIGGLPATSPDGITLNGSGNLSSISIKILAGVDGNRGQVIVNDGLASLMDQLLEEYVGKKGELELRAETFDEETASLAKTQKKIDDKSIFLEQKYLKKWNAVDLLLSQLHSTSEMLDQLMRTMPKLKIKD
ncbi:MAG: flagellar filament capping protein FliD [Legionella sp.]|uniref:flagellar filament capping protein FliD n=1 Tax=Legionella sp. TaxID=459 RepID=UPI0039E5E6D6